MTQYFWAYFLIEFILEFVCLLSDRNWIWFCWLVEKKQQKWENGSLLIRTFYRILTFNRNIGTTNWFDFTCDKKLSYHNCVKLLSAVQQWFIFIISFWVLVKFLRFRTMMLRSTFFQLPEAHNFLFSFCMSSQHLNDKFTKHVKLLFMISSLCAAMNNTILTQKIAWMIWLQPYTYEPVASNRMLRYFLYFMS